MTDSKNSSTYCMTTTFALIIIGDEILSGKRADKHLPKVIELLAARGLALDYAEYVGDSPERITAALKRAFASGDVVFSTGGIGATPDDHTRQCAAKALGVELALHPQAEALIRERMQDTAREQGTVYEPDRPDNIHRLNMGVFPKGAEIIPNPYNKIPGFFCESPFERRTGAAPSSEGPLGGQRPTPSGGAWGHTFRSGVSGNGVADDRMGARYEICAPASNGRLDRKVRDRFWCNGSSLDTLDGGHRA